MAIKISKSRIDLSGEYLAQALLKDWGETKTAPSISSGTLTLDLSTGNVFEVSLNANITTLSITNPPATGNACSFTLIFTADGTPRSVTWGSSVKWSGTVAPTLTSTNGKKDIFTFYTSDAGTNWYGFVGGQAMVVPAQFITATGGTITTDGDYKVHRFTASDTFTVTELGANPTYGSVLTEVLVVAGGGSGGMRVGTIDAGGGGGGAGGLCYQTNRSVTATGYTVTIGGGGTHPTSGTTSGADGSNTVFDTITAVGGGGGGAYAVAGRNGGSGGGEGRDLAGDNPGTATQGNSGGATGFGSNGGSCTGGGGVGSAGGGGAGAVGHTADSNNTIADGGNGKQYAITGTTLYYADGGGGCREGTGAGGAGGQGTGGTGSGNNIAGTDGMANRGGGGGAGNGSSSQPGSGGSGVVIVRYKFQ